MCRFIDRNDMTRIRYNTYYEQINSELVKKKIKVLLREIYKNRNILVQIKYFCCFYKKVLVKLVIFC